jgi:hypothetical protein
MAPTDTAPASVAVTFVNNSGFDIVVAMVQGLTPGQSLTEAAWLSTNSVGESSWVVPSNLGPESNLDAYLTDLGRGASLVINVPAYAARVGFRCLVAATAYRQHAIQSYKGTYYLAFPDLLTATYDFDKFEAGLTTGIPGIWNITAVDFFALPMQLSTSSATVGYKKGVTSMGLWERLWALPAPYSAGGSVAPNTSKNIYRFFSPSHLGGAAAKALDVQISTGLSALPANTTTVKYGNYVLSDFKASSTISDGAVVGTVTCEYSYLGSPAKSVTVDDVTSINAFAGTIVGDGSNAAVQGALGAIISAAICRGVLGQPAKWGDIVHSNTNCPTPWNYYAANAQSNAYSHLIHQYSIDGKNYGFPYDDYFGDEAGFTVLPGEAVRVTILPYDGPFKAQANPVPPVQTGSLVATVPDSSIYPAGQGWQIGPISVGTKPLTPGANIFCNLDSDTVVCTFPGYTKDSREMHIDMNATNLGDAVTFWDNGVQNKALGITGLVYDPATRALAFGQTASWTG